MCLFFITLHTEYQEATELNQICQTAILNGKSLFTELY
jgi:hypothetical protein